MQNTPLPQFVVFEGVDGSGKTTLARALTDYYRTSASQLRLYANSFPGSTPGTLGEWVYRLHHHQNSNGLSAALIAPAALQLLHIAAHVDALFTSITPTLTRGGCVILDRYWWSTYSYSRLFLPTEQVWPLVNAERIFLAQLPYQPIIIYLTRTVSLKGHELSANTHIKLDHYYREVANKERDEHVPVHEINNDGSLEQTWTTLLSVLGLPYRPYTS